MELKRPTKNIKKPEANEDENRIAAGVSLADNPAVDDDDTIADACSPEDLAGAITFEDGPTVSVEPDPLPEPDQNDTSITAAIQRLRIAELRNEQAATVDDVEARKQLTTTLIQLASGNGSLQDVTTLDRLRQYLGLAVSDLSQISAIVQTAVNAAKRLETADVIEARRVGIVDKIATTRDQINELQKRLLGLHSELSNAGHADEVARRDLRSFRPLQSVLHIPTAAQLLGVSEADLS